jgi:hypothetical protein
MKLLLLRLAEVRTLPRGTIHSVANPTHNIIAVGWLDNKAVHFISTADTANVKVVKRRVSNAKVDVQAPELICNYKKYTGSVDQHDKLCSKFSLGEKHKLKKY